MNETIMKPKEMTGYCLVNEATGAPLAGQDEHYDGSRGPMYIRVYPTEAMAQLVAADMRVEDEDGVPQTGQPRTMKVSLMYHALDI